MTAAQQPTTDWALGPPAGTAKLRHRVRARLIADPGVDAGHIRVTAHCGLVTLSGHVTSHLQKAAAKAAAQRLSGVDRVANDLVVGLPRHPSPRHPRRLTAKPPTWPDEPHGPGTQAP